ncbi:MAG: HAD hydrolase family protein, partial [Planctomycetota bacterium]
RLGESPSVSLRLGELDHLAACGVFHTGAVGHCPVSGFAAHDLVGPDLVAHLVARSLAERPDTVIGLSHPERGMAVNRDLPDSAIADLGVEPGSLRPFAEARVDAACKLTLWTDDLQPLDDLAEHLLAGAGGGIDCHLADGGTCLLITRHGVSKASMLLRLLAHLDLDPAHCAGIGDDITDVPFLHLVGRPIAIAGGHPAALASTDTHVPPPHEGGWARAVDLLLDG